MAVSSDYLTVRGILAEWHATILDKGPVALPVLADRLDDEPNPFAREAAAAIRYWNNVRTGVRTSSRPMDEWFRRVISKYGDPELRITDGGNITRAILTNRILNWFVEATIDETVNYKLIADHPITNLTITTVNWATHQLLANTDIMHNVCTLTLDFRNYMSFVSTGMSYILENLRGPHLYSINIIPGQNDIVGKGLAVVCLMQNKRIAAGTRILWNGKDT